MQSSYMTNGAWDVADKQHAHELLTLYRFADLHLGHHNVIILLLVH